VDLKPYPYQQAGIDFLAAARKGILADEMGLGKTPQSLLAAAKEDAFPILVVAPKPAFGVWETESLKWLDIPTYVYGGAKRELPKETPPIVITSYALFGEVLKRRAWRLTVYDEAHRLRNRKSRTLFQIAKDTPSRNIHMLSGTPIVGELDDMWPLLHLARPETWRYYWPFVKRYMFAEQDPVFGFWKHYGAQHTQELRERTADHFLRRLERVVAPERPPRTRQQMPLEMEGLQKRLYNEMAEDALIQWGDNWLAAPTEIAKLTRLRQLLTTPLLLGYPDEGAGFRALRETFELTPHPAAVYVPFAEAIPHLERYLTSVARVYTITADRSAKAASIAREFDTANERSKVLIVSLQLGVGWEALSTANPYFLGLDWSPHFYDQAERRHARHGQHHPVTAHYLTHQGTVEDYAMDILDKKTTIRLLALDPQNMLRGRR